MKILFPLLSGLLSAIALVMLLDYNRVESNRNYLPRHVRQSWGKADINPYVSLYPTQTEWVPEGVTVIREPPKMVGAELMAAQIQQRVGLAGLYILLFIFFALDSLVVWGWLRKLGHV